jgi:hypothetical protein
MADMTTLAAFTEYFTWWQPLLLVLVIALIVFWVMYRRRQM